MKQRAPDVLDFLATIAVPEIKEQNCCRAENSTFVHCMWNSYEHQMEKNSALFKKSMVSCLVLEMLLKE